MKVVWYFSEHTGFSLMHNYFFMINGFKVDLG